MKKKIALFFICLIILSALPVISFNLKPARDLVRANEAAKALLAGAPGERFSFIVIGDPEAGLFLNEASTLKIIRNINREGRFKEKADIIAVFTTGDNTFRGAASHYKNYVKIVSMLKFPVITTPGNHDYDRGGGRRFKEYIGPEEFAFARGDSRFIVINDADGDMSDEKLRWFENELKNGAGYKHRFVFMHKPPFNPYQQSWYRIENSAWTARFRKLCEEYRVDIVFAGHEHMFKEAVFNGVRYIVTGGGGMLPTFPSCDGGYIHYVRVDVNGDYVSYEVRKIQPPLWLWLVYYLWKDLFYIVKGFIV